MINEIWMELLFDRCVLSYFNVIIYWLKWNHIGQINTDWKLKQQNHQIPKQIDRFWIHRYFKDTLHVLQKSHLKYSLVTNFISIYSCIVLREHLAFLLSVNTLFYVLIILNKILLSSKRCYGTSGHGTSKRRRGTKKKKASEGRNRH